MTYAFLFAFLRTMQFCTTLTRADLADLADPGTLGTPGTQGTPGTPETREPRNPGTPGTQGPLVWHFRSTSSNFQQTSSIVKVKKSHAFIYEINDADKKYFETLSESIEFFLHQETLRE